MIDTLSGARSCSSCISVMPVHLVHIQVGQHNVEVLGPQKLQRVRAGGRGGDLVPVELEDALNRRQHRLFVVDDEHTRCDRRSGSTCPGQLLAQDHQKSLRDFGLDCCAAARLAQLAQAVERSGELLAQKPVGQHLAQPTAGYVAADGDVDARALGQRLEHECAWSSAAREWRAWQTARGGSKLDDFGLALQRLAQQLAR